jgi:ThiF family
MNTEISRNAEFARRVLGVSDASRLSGTRVVIVLGDDWSNTRLGQLMFVTVANILARLFEYCPSIALIAPRVPAMVDLPLVNPGGDVAENLAETLHRLARKGFRGKYLAHPDGGQYDVALIIGEAEVDADVKIHIVSDGWSAYAGLEPDLGNPISANPLGALLAAGWGAALVAGRIFHRIAPDEFRFPSPPSGTWFSSFDYSIGTISANPVLPELRLGEFPVVGLGALGAAVTYSLGVLPQPQGKPFLIDKDQLSDTNIERHFTAIWEDAEARSIKVDHARAFLNRFAPTLETTAERCLFEEWSRRDDPFEVLLCGTDSPESRRMLQFQLPRELINAGTGGEGFTVSRHRLDTGACLACLFPERKNSTGDLEDVMRQFGVSREVAIDLLEGLRNFDEEIAASMREHGRVVFPDALLGELIGRPFVQVRALACSQALIRPDLPVPTIGFVSFIPGVLMVAELIKSRHFPNALLTAGRNVLRVPNVFALHEIDLEPTRKTHGCRCQDPIITTAYERRWSLSLLGR